MAYTLELCRNQLLSGPVAFFLYTNAKLGEDQPNLNTLNNLVMLLRAQDHLIVAQASFMQGLEREEEV